MYILHIVLGGGGGASWAFAAEVPSELIQLYMEIGKVTLIKDI